MKGEPYCDNCKAAILEFADRYGAGALTKDEFVENLRLNIKNLENDKDSLEKYITKIRPKADAYDRICETLGIKDNILEYINKLKEKKE